MRLAAPFTIAGDQIGFAAPGGRALFTTRRGGVSGGPYASLNIGHRTDDEPADVRANRARVARLAGIEADRIAVAGRQVHGTTVMRVLAAPDDGAPQPDADGQATALRGVAALVQTADCLPVALISPDAVAMVHAGWRGLAGGVLAEGVRALRELGGAAPIVAAIGPGAGPCCYETGAEVHAAFARFGNGVRRGRALDLKLAARLELEAAGVERVHDSGLCTICAGEELFFSHRRDGGHTGRQGGLAWRS